MEPAHEVRGNAPDRVDLRDALWPVENVGTLLAAAASAATAALEYHCNRMGRQPTNLSTLFVHYNARKASGSHGSNRGTTLRAALQAIVDHGACTETSWPFDPAKWSLEPPTALYEEARAFAGLRYATPADPLEALALRYPVPVAVRVPASAMKDAGRSGSFPAVSGDLVQREGFEHALLLVGYDRPRRLFIARNCWGAAWGDKGHCTIDFDAMAAVTPKGAPRFWFVAAPKAAPVAKSESAAEPAMSSSAPLSDLAARMRDEIRGSLQRDLDEATRRIRESLRRR